MMLPSKTIASPSILPATCRSPSVTPMLPACTSFAEMVRGPTVKLSALGTRPSAPVRRSRPISRRRRSSRSDDPAVRDVVDVSCALAGCTVSTKARSVPSARRILVPAAAGGCCYGLEAEDGAGRRADEAERGDGESDAANLLDGDEHLVTEQSHHDVAERVGDDLADAPA